MLSAMIDVHVRCYESSKIQYHGPSSHTLISLPHNNLRGRYDYYSHCTGEEMEVMKEKYFTYGLTVSTW